MSEWCGNLHTHVFAQNLGGGRKKSREAFISPSHSQKTLTPTKLLKQRKWIFVQPDLL